MKPWEEEKERLAILLQEYKRYNDGKEVHYPFAIFAKDVDKAKIIDMYEGCNERIFEQDECEFPYDTYGEMIDVALKYSTIDEQFQRFNELMEEIMKMKMLHFFSIFDRIKSIIERYIIYGAGSFSNIKELIKEAHDYFRWNFI